MDQIRFPRLKPRSVVSEVCFDSRDFESEYLSFRLTFDESKYFYWHGRFTLESASGGGANGAQGESDLVYFVILVLNQTYLGLTLYPIFIY